MDKLDNVFLEPLRAFLVQIGAFLPRLGVALLVLLAGVLLAKAARFAVTRGLRAVNFHILTERSGMDGFLQKGGSDVDTVRLLGIFSYWVVILAALIVAFNGLGLDYVTGLLGRVMVFVPRVIVATLILALGAYFARFVGHAVQSYCRAVGLHEGELLGRIARYAILVFVLMIALDHLDIGGSVVRYSFLIILTGVVFAVALAFGLGGKDWAAARLEAWWPTTPRDRRPD